MPKTLFLSPDPRPNHPFTATLVIEGTDAAGNPLAAVGDEYIIGCVTPMAILFDQHILTIESIDEKADHRAELVFVSRDGFTKEGSFTITFINADNPMIQGEELVKVVKTISTTVFSPASEEPLAPKTTEPVKDAVSTETKPAASTEVPTPSTYVPPNSGHPIVWALVILGVCVLAIASNFMAMKPQVVPPVSATRQTDASITTNKPDAANETDSGLATPVPIIKESAPPVKTESHQDPATPKEEQEWKIDLNE